MPPEIQVRTTFVGADAEALEQSVAVPIEQQMSGVDNMNYMYSVNANNGTMQLRVNFDVKTDPNTDQILSQLRVTQANPQLPGDVVNFGVLVQKSTSAPLLLISLHSPKGTYDNIFLANYAYINLIDQINRVKGVSNVNVFGAGQYAMRLWIRPDLLAKLGLTVTDIASAIRTQNNVNPAGPIGSEPVPPGQEFTYAVHAPGRLTTPEEFGKIVIRANTDGSLVRVSDVARIELGAQTYSLQGRLNGESSAVLAIYQLPGHKRPRCGEGRSEIDGGTLAKIPRRSCVYGLARHNPGSQRRNARDTLDSFRRTHACHNRGIHLSPKLARHAYSVVRGPRFPSLALLSSSPYSVSRLTRCPCSGLVLAIGLVVDDAIVVVEAVERHIEEGMTPRDASIKAMEEVQGPVIGIALVLASVFVPTAFVPGITGRLYQQFALTIALSVILSAFNALTLSPALSALLLKPRKTQSGFFGWFNRTFKRANDNYVSLSRLAIRRSAISAYYFGYFWRPPRC